MWSCCAFRIFFFPLKFLFSGIFINWSYCKSWLAHENAWERVVWVRHRQIRPTKFIKGCMTRALLSLICDTAPLNQSVIVRLRLFLVVDIFSFQLITTGPYSSICLWTMVRTIPALPLLSCACQQIIYPHQQYYLQQIISVVQGENSKNAKLSCIFGIYLDDRFFSAGSRRLSGIFEAIKSVYTAGIGGVYFVRKNEPSSFATIRSMIVLSRFVQVDGKKKRSLDCFQIYARCDRMVDIVREDRSFFHTNYRKIQPESIADTNMKNKTKKSWSLIHVFVLLAGLSRIKQTMRSGDPTFNEGWSINLHHSMESSPPNMGCRLVSWLYSMPCKRCAGSPNNRTVL